MFYGSFFEVWKKSHIARFTLTLFLRQILRTCHRFWSDGAVHFGGLDAKWLFNADRTTQPAYAHYSPPPHARIILLDERTKQEQNSLKLR